MSVSRPLFFIPARGGSKGVIKKNIRQVGGNPLIYWSIKSAINANLGCPIVVSSDDPDILIYSSQFSEVTTIMRDKKLSSDDTPMVDVLHDLLLPSGNFSSFNTVILLQPTAPFRTSNDIQNAFDLFRAHNSCRSLVSVCHHPDIHPARMYYMNNKELVAVDQSRSSKNRQDLKPVYHRNGCIYISTSSMINDGSILCPSPIPYLMPLERSLNIDTEFDLIISRLYKNYQLKNNTDYQMC